MKSFTNLNNNSNQRKFIHSHRKKLIMFDDKQNIDNNNHVYSHNNKGSINSKPKFKIPQKTGIQIRNKLKRQQRQKYVQSTCYSNNNNNIQQKQKTFKSPLLLQSKPTTSSSTQRYLLKRSSQKHDKINKLNNNNNNNNNTNNDKQNILSRKNNILQKLQNNIKKSTSILINRSRRSQQQRQKQLPAITTSNLSRTSSTSSIKSVTFSVCSNYSTRSNASILSNVSNHSKKSILKNKLKKVESGEQNNKINFNGNGNVNRSMQSTSSLTSLSEIMNNTIINNNNNNTNKLDNNSQSIQNLYQNNLILQKYNSILKQLQSSSQKYTDPQFPPCEQSIYIKNKSMQQLVNNLQQDNLKIKWMRLPQLYKHYNIKLWQSQQQQHIINNDKNQQSDSSQFLITKGFITTTHNQSQYLYTVFNSINMNKNKRYFMEKYFQYQSIDINNINNNMNNINNMNNNGVYYVKIFDSEKNIWKYVIVDDYIPVIVKVDKERKIERVVKPAFINLEYQYQLYNNHNHNIKKTIQIWPFLLQKAYAKHYSTYDTLAKGNSLDFLQQITGSYYQTIQLSSSQSQTYKQRVIKTKQILLNPYNIVFIETQQKQFTFVTKYQQKQSNCNKEQNGTIYLYNRKSNRIQQFNMNQLLSNQIKFHYISPCQYSHKITSQINIKQQKQSSYHNNSHISKQSYSNLIIRKFTLVQSSSSCTISLTQKQQRLVKIQQKNDNFNVNKNNKNNKNININGNKNKPIKYSYSWFRLILVMKQLNSYRWITGEYSNNKTIKLNNLILQSGQYYLLIFPQYQSYQYNFHISLHSSSSTQISHIFLSPNNIHAVIQQSFSDHAQRHGTLLQINQNICSYNYIDYNLGFIIENINNEKSTGDVKILRTIQGLEEFGIKPLNNKEFDNKDKKLEIKIQKMSGYTVVLKTINGVDKEFLEQFDFGS